MTNWPHHNMQSGICQMILLKLAIRLLLALMTQAHCINFVLVIRQVACKFLFYGPIGDMRGATVYGLNLP